MNRNSKKHIPKDVFINGSRVYVEENGEVKTDYCDKIKRNGYMSVEEAMDVTIATVMMIYELNGTQ